jgi:hypothetical protein
MGVTLRYQTKMTIIGVTVQFGLSCKIRAETMSACERGSEQNIVVLETG